MDKEKYFKEIVSLVRTAFDEMESDLLNLTLEQVFKEAFILYIQQELEK